MKVIARRYLPVESPLTSTLAVLLALDHWHAPGWAYGACGLLYAVLWILFFVQTYLEEPVSPSEITPRGKV